MNKIVRPRCDLDPRRFKRKGRDKAKESQYAYLAPRTWPLITNGFAPIFLKVIRTKMSIMAIATRPGFPNLMLAKLTSVDNPCTIPCRNAISWLR